MILGSDGGGVAGPCPSVNSNPVSKAAERTADLSPAPDGRVVQAAPQWPVCSYLACLGLLERLWPSPAPGGCGQPPSMAVHTLTPALAPATGLCGYPELVAGGPDWCWWGSFGRWLWGGQGRGNGPRGAVQTQRDQPTPRDPQLPHPKPSCSPQAGPSLAGQQGEWFMTGQAQAGCAPRGKGPSRGSQGSEQPRRMSVPGEGPAALTKCDQAASREGSEPRGRDKNTN